MKKTIFACMLMIFAASYAHAATPANEQLDKLNSTAIKKFQYSEKRNKIVEVSGGITNPYPGTKEDAAKLFLKENHALFNLSEGLTELNNNPVIRDRDTVIFDQYYQNVAVAGAGVNIVVDSKNRVTSVTALIRKIEKFNATPKITPDELKNIIKSDSDESASIKLIIYFINDKSQISYESEGVKPVLYYDVLSNDYHWMVDVSDGHIVYKLIMQ